MLANLEDAQATSCWQPQLSCAKCGDLFYRQGNRQKYCTKCSPYMRPPFLKEYGCPRCGKPLTQVRARQRPSPCPDCAKIQERQQVASDIRSERAHRKSAAKFGKWLIEEAERAMLEDPDLPPYLARAWTPFRYVSQEELDTLKDPKADQWWDRGAVVLARSSFREVGCIYRPGFYRVDPLMGRSGFYRACAEGIPFHHTSRVSQAYDSWRQRKVEAGREKHFVALNKRIAADALEMRRRKNGKKRIPTRSVRFFRALAMAGVVTKQHEE